MNDLKNKRNYIRKKKFLNDSISQICNTLKLIKTSLNQNISDVEIQKEALIHAQAIEATCWSPHLRHTEESYQYIMATKTNELCIAIAQQRIPPSLLKPLNNFNKKILPEIKSNSLPIQNSIFFTDISTPPPQLPSSSLVFDNNNSFTNFSDDDLYNSNFDRDDNVF